MNGSILKKFLDATLSDNGHSENGNGLEEPSFAHKQELLDKLKGDNPEGLLTYILRRIESNATLPEILDLIFDLFRDLIPFERLSLALLEEDATVVRCHWMRSEVKETALGPHFSAPLRETSLGDVIQWRKPRVIGDLQEALRRRPQSHTLGALINEGARSNLTFPLFSVNQPIGFLFFTSPEKDAFTTEHIAILERLALDVSFLIERAWLRHGREQEIRMIGCVAHELRNPLTILKGYTGLLLQPDVVTDEANRLEILERVNVSIERMRLLINDLLDISAFETGEFRVQLAAHNVGEFLRDWEGTGSLLARHKHMKFSLSIEDNPPDLMLDQSRLEQTLNNLVTNASKYSKSGGPLDVRAYRHSENRYRIEVSDEGMGIPSEDLNRIFWDYKSACNNIGDTERSVGLGLPIARRIVEAHKGKIWVESEINVGSTFFIELPYE